MNKFGIVNVSTSVDISDEEELCNALNVPLVPNILTRESATKEEILEDAFLVLAYALEQCNEHVYLQKLMHKYLSTLPADDNVKATINTDTPLVDSYMRAKATKCLNVDWKTGTLCAPLFRSPVPTTTTSTTSSSSSSTTTTTTTTTTASNPEGVDGTATATTAPKKKQHKTKYDKWMEHLGWNSMNKTRQLYILWNFSSLSYLYFSVGAKHNAFFTFKSEYFKGIHSFP